VSAADPAAGVLDPVDDPIALLEVWLEDARAAGVAEPAAMALATADPDGRPGARMVLLRGLDQRGLTFYTNRGSEKGRDLAANPRAAVVFHWEGLGRQVRLRGAVRRLEEEESRAYFETRPPGHRLAAWASPQGQVIADRAEIERRYAEVAASFAAEDVPLPPFWGGYRLVPEELEFWVSRPDRLHDRLHYRRAGASWQVERLAP
jgi:pyridoxamine 5'-phosphate oxidase